MNQYRNKHRNTVYAINDPSPKLVSSSRVHHQWQKVEINSYNMIKKSLNTIEKTSINPKPLSRLEPRTVSGMTLVHEISYR